MDHPDLPFLAMLARLGAALLAGAVIGLERERHRRPAGLRTHVLVSMASALFAMISIFAAGEANDPGRIAAQVVTGIGFLGAGTIMRHGSTVQGLTTAASLWMAAALGLACGFGWFEAAGAATLAAFLVLTLAVAIEDRLPRKRDDLHMTLHGERGHDTLPQVLRALRDLGAAIGQVKFGEEKAEEGQQFTVAFTVPASLGASAVARVMTAQDGVHSVGSDQ